MDGEKRDEGEVHPHARGTISVNKSLFYNVPHLITATKQGGHQRNGTTSPSSQLSL